MKARRRSFVAAADVAEPLQQLRDEAAAKARAQAATWPYYGLQRAIALRRRMRGLPFSEQPVPGGMFCDFTWR